jgi:hypothetical protein
MLTVFDTLLWQRRLNLGACVLFNFLAEDFYARIPVRRSARPDAQRRQPQYRHHSLCVVLHGAAVSMWSPETGPAWPVRNRWLHRRTRGRGTAAPTRRRGFRLEGPRLLAGRVHLAIVAAGRVRGRRRHDVGRRRSAYPRLQPGEAGRCAIHLALLVASAHNAASALRPLAWCALTGAKRPTASSAELGTVRPVIRLDGPRLSR